MFPLAYELISVETSFRNIGFGLSVRGAIRMIRSYEQSTSTSSITSMWSRSAVSAYRETHLPTSLSKWCGSARIVSAIVSQASLTADARSVVTRSPSYIANVIPAKSDGILRCAFSSQTTKTLSLPRTPMKRPHSKITLSRGEAEASPRLSVVSSADHMKTAQSNSFAFFARVSRVPAPTRNTFSFQPVALPHPAASS